MTDTDHEFWSQVKHFTPDEFGPGADHLSSELILELDAFRAFLGEKIVVTSGYREGDPHEHGKGLAVDIVIPKLGKMKLVNALFAAMRFKFRGIGIYSDWAYKGEVVGGLHLDMRVAEYRALWSAKRNMDNRNVYYALDTMTLRGLGLL